MNIDNSVKAKEQNKQIHNHMNEDIKDSYECPYCAKKFDSNSNLKDHIINHSGPNVLRSEVLDSEESDWETDDE